MTNGKTAAERAYHRAADTLLWYGSRYDKGMDDETRLSDLLADLRHFAAEHGIAWGALEERALGHFVGEVSNDGFCD